MRLHVQKHRGKTSLKEVCQMPPRLVPVFKGDSDRAGACILQVHCMVFQNENVWSNGVVSLLIQNGKVWGLQARLLLTYASLLAKSFFYGLIL